MTDTPTLEELRRALAAAAATGGLEPVWRRANRLANAYAAAHNLTRSEVLDLAAVR